MPDEIPNQLSAEVALENWFADYQKRRRRFAWVPAAKFAGCMAAIVLILFLWFQGPIKNYLQRQWDILVWKVSTTAVYRGPERIIQTANGFEKQAKGFGQTWQTYESLDFKDLKEQPVPNPISTPGGQTALLLAVGLIGLMAAEAMSRKRYLLFDESGLLLSDSAVVGKGEAEFIRWDKLSKVEMPGQSLVFRLDNGRIVKIPWQQAVATAEPSALANALKLHAPKAAAECEKLHTYY